MDEETLAYLDVSGVKDRPVEAYLEKERTGNGTQIGHRGMNLVWAAAAVVDPAMYSKAEAWGLRDGDMHVECRDSKKCFE